MKEEEGEVVISVEIYRQRYVFTDSQKCERQNRIAVSEPSFWIDFQVNSSKVKNHSGGSNCSKPRFNIDQCRINRVNQGIQFTFLLELLVG